jgi:glycosyltransferase involved in cell wall biosynthesis
MNRPESRKAPSDSPRLLIVHASSDLYGSSRACLTVAEAAVEAGFTTEVLIPDQGPLASELERVGAGIRILDTLVLRRADLRGTGIAHAPRAWLSSARHLWQFSRKHRYDIVHSNCAPTLGGALLARWWGVPHIWHIHELMTNEPLVRGFFSVVLRTADALLATSQAVADQFKSESLRRKTRVAHPGAVVPHNLTTSKPMKREVPVITCVGRLNAGKGQSVLIEAVKILHDGGYPVRLDLVGDVFGNEDQFRDLLVQRVSDLGLDSSVRFLGERRDALELIGDSDVFVLPSTSPEPFGIVVVEAMALGRPVIATRGGGPSEIITNTHDGLLVDPNNPAQIATAVKSLMNHPELVLELTINAADRGRELTPDQLRRTVVTIYRELLASD